MMKSTEIAFRHAEYVDPRAGNDKFYRTYVIGSSWVTQYGRNGTAGTFTQLMESDSPGAATKAADAKFASKIKKGYKPVRQGTAFFDGQVTADNLHVLDALAAQVGDDTTFEVESVAAAKVAETCPDRTAEVVTALTDFPGGHRDSTEEEKNPSLPTRPMLASVQPGYAVDSVMENDGWVAQLKYDGDRVVIEVRDGVVSVLNRQGQVKATNVGTTHTTPFTALHTGRWVFDGEIVGRTLALFDMVAATDGNRTWVDEDTPFGFRYEALVRIAAALGLTEDESFIIAPVADDLATPGAKADLLAEAVAGQREGIILRDRNGQYQPGRRCTFLIKNKFIKDADVVVSALHETKQSAELSVTGRDGEPVVVGHASTIGKGEVALGDVWVATFLYVTDPQHPTMFQPRLVRRRDDKSATECHLAQFADAGTTKNI